MIYRKVARLLGLAMTLPFWAIVYLLAVPIVLMIRAIRPWLLVRFGSLISSRIGHFAADVEVYCCEQDAGINVPKQKHLDFFHFNQVICNEQLALMWKRVLRIWPIWILAPIRTLNRIVPGGAPHEIGDNTQFDRDVHNLYDRIPPHLSFTPEEEARGEAGLIALGIPPNAPFVCLSVRDSAYLESHLSLNDPLGWSYHDYRDCDVQSFVLAAEELADRGYFVVRMGAKVRNCIKSNHSRVIDYACSGLRTDFMDIYLCANCEFMISTGEGLVCVPRLFRRPVAFVNLVPLGYFFTYFSNSVGIAKHHRLRGSSEGLSLRDIFSRGAGYCTATLDYEKKGIQLINNTAEEIRDVAVEMAERLSKTWRDQPEDEKLQAKFWQIFPRDAVDTYRGRQLHGEIRSRFGAAFLRQNPNWLQ